MDIKILLFALLIGSVLTLGYDEDPDTSYEIKVNFADDDLDIRSSSECKSSEKCSSKRTTTKPPKTTKPTKGTEPPKTTNLPKTTEPPKTTKPAKTTEPPKTTKPPKTTTDSPRPTTTNPPIPTTTDPPRPTTTNQPRPTTTEPPKPTTQPTTTTTTPSPGVPTCPVNPEVNYPHHTCCNLYYDCGNGIAYLRQCPANLHYDPVLKVCNYPYAVNCQLPIQYCPYTPAARGDQAGSRRWRSLGRMGRP